VNHMHIAQSRTRAGTTTYRLRWTGADGRRIVRSFDAKHDAKTLATGLQVRRQLAEVDRSQITLDDYTAQIWVPVYSPQLAPCTRATYRYIYAEQLRPHLGARPLAEITPALIARWQSERLQSGIDLRSVRRAVLVLSGILQTAVRAHYLAVNPARALHATGLAG
jgi:hypothetical protein